MTMESASAASAHLAAKGANAFIGGAGLVSAITLAALVVMVVTRPRTAGEWAVGLISTVICSMCLGAGVVLYLGLHRTVQSADLVEAYTGLMVVIGVVFACGLPGWVFVRVIFNTLTKYQDKSLDDVYRDAKDLLP